MQKPLEIILVSATPEPRKILKLCWDIINTPFLEEKPIYSLGDLENVTREFLKSGLGGALEMVNFVFLYKGVSRAFTHQMVRTRLASYMQQSQRHTKFENGLPVIIPDTVRNSGCEKVYEGVIDKIEQACAILREKGIPTEDIRGLYPTNVQTNIVQAIDYNALRHQLSHRLCTQTQQGEWGIVAKEIKRLVTEYDHILGEALSPVCTLTGRCAFNTSLDRECELRNRLEANL